MPGAWCCVPFCHNEGGHRFPKDEELRRLWSAAVRRDDWEPSNHSIVCYKHFKEADYIASTKNGYKPLRRKLRKDSVPSIFVATESLLEQEHKVKIRTSPESVTQETEESDVIQNLVPESWLPPLESDVENQSDDIEADLKDRSQSPNESPKASSDADWNPSDASDQGSSDSCPLDDAKQVSAVPVSISPSPEREDAVENGCAELKFFQSMMPQLKKLPPLELLKLKSRFVNYLIEELQENANLE